ncbi:hypothetical protein [Scytonema sp. PRP1]|uniref:hypothetical protein n=1 Tax=Scytonema sp. PRP1 TaxID=3120513 RepID=UPI002FD1149C
MYRLFNKRLTALGLLMATYVGGYTLFQTPVSAKNLEKNIQELALINIPTAEDTKTIPSTINDTQPTTLLLAKSSQNYVGTWSNGRGETLLINPNTIKFGNDKKVSYKNVTRATDGTYFEIQITSSGKINFFQKFLSLKIEGKQMTMTGYNSYRDMNLAQNQGLQVTWYRD